MQAKQMALEIRRQNEGRLHQIQSALRRMEQGKYGVCSRCEEEIALPRLKAKPEALFCVPCTEPGKSEPHE